VTAEYRIRNRGGDTLRLGKATSSCGCSVLAVEPKVIPPGGEAVVSVRGTIPGAGERTVTFRVESNDPERPELEFELDLVGSKAMPYVADSSGSVQLGIVGKGGTQEPVWVTAHEKKGSKPWLASVDTNVAGLTLEG